MTAEENETAVRSAHGRLPCPRCGAAMNRHAVRVVKTIFEERDGDESDGVLQEFHTCPVCRYVLERRES